MSLPCRFFSNSAGLRSLLLAVIASLSAVAGAAAPRRSIPEPLPAHPGNVFLESEEVCLPVPAGLEGAWQLTDYEGRTVASGPTVDGQARVGRLPVGYYELGAGSGPATNRSSLAVLGRLRAPTPRTSPIGADVALAWLVPPEKMAATANLCALAGLNWVRDRLNWAELMPGRERLIASNRYDHSLRLQSEAGLRGLTVNHISPAWANPNTKRFPTDLRDTYHFYAELARRWRGTVDAIEPWNEADIGMFGGHTGSEIASFQKAAWLGLKAGNPKIIACLNVLAIHRPDTLLDLDQNAAWPFFDTYNLHHYEPFKNYAALYTAHRAVSAGKPLWTTECSVPVHWTGDPQAQEPAPADLRLQSERVAMTFAHALFEGAQNVFYFVLPHYVEGQTQFGLLRRDLTPRPAYVALAAAGRLLADAKPVGRLMLDNPGLTALLLDAKPDGRRSQVLVAWTDSDAEASLTLPKAPRSVYDHLGRLIDVPGTKLKLTRAPVFVLLAPGTKPALTPPPARPRTLGGKPCPVVLQALLPESQVVLDKSAYRLPAGQSAEVPLFVYNFGPHQASGRLKLTRPAGCEASLPESVTVAPGDRVRLNLQVKPAPRDDGAPVTLRIDGDFDPLGRCEFSLRLQPDAR